MFTYNYPKTATPSISIVDENMNQVAFIDYSIEENTLHIIEIERTSYAGWKYDSSFHFGIDVFSQLLKEIYIYI